MAGLELRLIALLSLLSRIRLGKTEIDLQKAAENQYLMPVIGAIIGSIVAIIAWFLFQFAIGYLNIFLVAVFLIIILYFITGIIHIEGLADFSDGIMASGDKDRKRSAMKDVSLGAAGTFAMIIDVILLIALLSALFETNRPSFTWIWGVEFPLIFGIILAEVSGKLSMITVMKIGPSSHPGMGSIFVNSSTSGRYLAGFGLSLIIGVLLAGIYGLIVIVGSLSGLFIALIARKHFGGVGGDSFGASNEIGRMLALTIWVIVL